MFSELEEQPEPELASTNARRPDPKVHSFTMSMSTPSRRKYCCQSAEAAQIATFPGTFVLALVRSIIWRIYNFIY